MKFTSSLLLLAMASVTLAADHLCTGMDYPCTSGVFILAARGTDSSSNQPEMTDPRYDIVQGLDTMVAQELIDKAKNGSYCRALPYAASGGPVNYDTSVAHGVEVGQGIIRDYVGRCGADSRIVLLGYSQGGQVMTAVLIGDAFRGGLGAAGKNIIGGAFFASPSFVAGFSPINGESNATKSGIQARTNDDYTRFNNVYGDRVRNYCQADDEFCASGGADARSRTIHRDEVKTYSDDAVAFLGPLVT